MSGSCCNWRHLINLCVPFVWIPRSSWESFAGNTICCHALCTGFNQGTGKGEFLSPFQNLPSPFQNLPSPYRPPPFPKILYETHVRAIIVSYIRSKFSRTCKFDSHKSHFDIVITALFRSRWLCEI